MSEPIQTSSMKSRLRAEQGNSISPFLRPSPEIRQKIYSYLLPPSAEEVITTINYDLNWPFLQHPSSTTFSPHQLDRCKCPRQQQPIQDPGNELQEHTYKRYICEGPDVIIRPKSRSFWVLQQPGIAFNILRPAFDEEIQSRPDAGIILVNKQIYHESLPRLYRGRNFLLLTGICSRGRYQAYATETWLSRLTTFARSHIQALSLLCQRNEEDCQDLHAIKAYRSLSLFIVENLPRFQGLGLSVLSLDIPLHVFGILFRRAGVHISVMLKTGDGGLSVFHDASHFLQFCGRARDEELVKMVGELRYEPDKADMDTVLDESLELRRW